MFWTTFSRMSWPLMRATVSASWSGRPWMPTFGGATACWSGPTMNANVPDARPPTVRPIGARDGGCRAELLAQVVHVGVHGVQCDGDTEGPGLVEQLIAGHDPARMPQQAFEQGELARREVHVVAVDGHPAQPFVELDRTVHEPSALA